MRIPWEMVLAFAIGLGLMCLVGYLLLVPMRFLWRLVAGGVLGALALWLVNAFGPSVIGGYCPSGSLHTSTHSPPVLVSSSVQVSFTALLALPAAG